METINIADLKLHEGIKILDLGCGEGRHTHACNWHNELITVVGVDLNFTDLTTAKHKGDNFFKSVGLKQIANYVCADGLNLPFAEQTFDIVICSEVLEHIPDYQGMLNEINRLLKFGGTLAVSVPRAWPERICWKLSDAYHQVAGGHLRIFDDRQLSEVITQQGYQQTQKYYAHALHSIYWWLRCLFWQRGETYWPCKTYHKLLVWDLIQKPRLTRTLEHLLNPIMGKSIIWHLIKTTPSSKIK